MILVRAPLRISFMGGGTDLPNYYRVSPGRVISTSINQHVYLAIHRTQFIDKIMVKYSTTEIVNSLHELKHDRVREGLLSLHIENNIEIGSFASIPMRIGLGSSSSFTVALIKGLHALLGKELNNRSVAEAACQIEIDRLQEPIGKQDQYASAFGGLNILEFGSDESVVVKPVDLTASQRSKFEKCLLLFFTGMTRDASSVLRTQIQDIKKHIETYTLLSQMVQEFYTALKSENIETAGYILHKSWELKKSLSSNISNNIIDDFYSIGLSSGAWGGKIVGAGGGGCVLFMAPEETHDAIRKSLHVFATINQLLDYKEIPVEFEDKGVEIVFNALT